MIKQKKRSLSSSTSINMNQQQQHQDESHHLAPYDDDVHQHHVPHPQQTADDVVSQNFQELFSVLR